MSFSSESFANFLKGVEDQYKDKAWVQSLVKVTGQPVAHVVLGVFAATFLLVLFVFGLETVSNLLLIVPIYASFKAIKSPEKKDDTQWLTYWVLVAVVLVLEEVVEDLFLPDEEEETANLAFLGFAYHLLKIVFFLWAADVNTKGAQLVFEKGVSPILSQVEAFLEQKGEQKAQ